MNIAKFTTVRELADSYLTHAGRHFGDAILPLCETYASPTWNDAQTAWVDCRSMVDCPNCVDLYDMAYLSVKLTYEPKLFYRTLVHGMLGLSAVPHYV
jgi:hypothetical protein